MAKKTKEIVVPFPLGTLKAIERNLANESVYKGLIDSGVPAVLGVDYSIGVSSGSLSTEIDMINNKYVVTWRP